MAFFRASELSLLLLYILLSHFHPIGSAHDKDEDEVGILYFCLTS